jgi:putative transposase
MSENDSVRPYQGLSELEYPFHDRTLTVTTCGRICMGHRKINLSIVFAGQNVGIREVADKIWLVSFMHYDLGFFDQECGRVTSAENPFDAKVTHVPGIDRKSMVGVTGFEPATYTSRT